MTSRAGEGRSEERAGRAMPGGAPPALGRWGRRAAPAIALMYGYRTIVGLLLAEPAISAASSLLRNVPGGDRRLLDEGGALLFETLWRMLPSVRRAAPRSAIGLVVASIVALVPLGALLHALTRAERSRLPAGLRDAFRRMPTYFALLGVATLAEALLGAIAVTVWAMFSEPLASPRAAAFALAITFVAATPLLAVTLLHDLARVAAAGRGAGFLDAAARALAVGRARPGALAAAFALAGAISALAAGLGLAAPFAIGLSTMPRWVAVLVVQQIAVFALVAIRAAYFARLAALDASRP